MNEQVVPGQVLREILMEKYPRAYAPRLDKHYFLPSEDFARSQLVGSTIRDYGFRHEVFDCDDFAVVLLGKVKERQFKEGWAYPPAIGMALGTLGNGLNHVTNVAVTEMEEVIWLDCIGHDMTNFKPRMIWI